MRYQASEGATYDYAPILQPGSKHGEWFTHDRERLYSVEALALLHTEPEAR